MFAKNPSESFVDLCDWLNNAVVWKKKKCPSQRGLIVEQQSESEHWIFKAITEPSHINWGKKAHLVCPEQRSQRCTVPSFESAVTEYYRSWFRPDARPFLATFLLLTAVNQEHTNIYLDICHAMRADVSESWLGVTFFLPTADEIADKCLDSTNTFAKHPFFFNDYYPGRQLARKVLHPQLQSINLTFHLLSLNSRPALLIKQHRLSGRISSAWWSPTVRPEHSERRDLGCQIVRLVRCYSSNKYGDYV